MMKATNIQSLNATPVHRESQASAFDWPLAYEAEALLRKHMAQFLAQSPFAESLAERMRKDCGTDFFEWMDHLVLPEDSQQALMDAGFVIDSTVETPNGERAYEHPRATLPRVLLRPKKDRGSFVVALRPEFVADFVSRNNLLHDPEGEPCSRFRRVIVSEANGTRLEAVERRSYRGFVPGSLGTNELSAIVKARELWRTRARSFNRDAEGFNCANQILKRSGSACHRFFRPLFLADTRRRNHAPAKSDVGFVGKLTGTRAAPALHNEAPHELCN